jgi:nitrate reductase NapD
MTKHASLLHISSAIVSVLPAHRDDVARLLSQMPGVEVFHQAATKIVIVMEAPESGVIGARLAEVATIDGVLSANMVFEQIASLAELGEPT